jgi:hypothetical protein
LAHWQGNNSQSEKNMKKILAILLKVSAITIAIGIGLLFLIILVQVVRFGIYDYKDLTHWREKTSPLHEDVIQDICLKFIIPPNDSRCKSGSKVYAPDFFGDITRAFRAKNGIYSTYDEVQNKIGKYQFDYEPPVTDGSGRTYFVVWYDLRGDRVFPIVMFFYGDGRLYRIIADVGD